jgi:phosphodiesterase/alkaline phosphatase D-like protein
MKQHTRRILKASWRLALAIVFALTVTKTAVAQTTLIASGSSWKYWDRGNVPGANWQSTGFNAGSWAAGNSELGYGDGDEATIVGYGPSSSSKYITTYFRRAFNVTNASAFSSLSLNIKRDDGIVVYLNGTEIHRSNMPNGTISYSTLASSAIDGASETVSTTVPASGLISGTNVIAAEIHQANITSSDMSFALSLSGLAPSVTHGPWSGGVTSSSARVKARVSAPNLSTRLLVSTSSNLSSPLYSGYVTSSSSKDNVVDFTIGGLAANTTYYYGIEVNGAVSSDTNRRGRFKTFPSGASSFKFAFASCGSYNEPGQQVYDAIKNENPLFFLSMGDLHYNDTNVTQTSAYWNNYKAILSTVNQAGLFRDVSLAYVWDDHDSAGNDSSKTSVGMPYAQQAYRDYVPSYTLATSSGPINQAFTVGRARFILSDLRSLRDPSGNTDSSSKTAMGATQKTWLKNEFLNAKNSGAKVIFWVSSFPYIANSAGSDNWGSYTYERREIADYLKANNIKNVVILSGDMHALAFDNGANSDYATGGGMPLRVCHAAALARSGSIKGGPYSTPAIAGTGQYGLMEVTDTGGTSVTLRFVGKHYTSGIKIDQTFTVTP